jgi:hypothetical protein
MRRRARAGAVSGLFMSPLSAEVSRASLQLLALEKYAPRGVRLVADYGQVVEWDSARSVYVVRIHAPGHPTHAYLRAGFEFTLPVTADELALQFHLACARWLEQVG